MNRQSKLCCVASVLCAGFVSSAAAAGFDSKNEDIEVRADASIRYNLGLRTEGQDPAILRNAGVDDGDRNFDRGRLVNNRVDFLVELDAAWRKSFGVRLSSAGWYDAAYAGGFDNSSIQTSNHMSGGNPALGLSSYAQRYYAGPSGEILDAFVFASTKIGGTSIHVRVGRHTVTWGDALLGAGAIHGVTYAQAPLDQAKAFASPGIEAKELYHPLTQLSTTIQISSELSFSGQYYLEWDATRVPESGTYLGAADALQSGGESLILGPGVRALRGSDITPRDSGDWGVAARWSPVELDGTTMGLYWRRFSDRLPQIIVNTGPANEYLLNYASGIELLGASVAGQVGYVSVGFDFNARRNMPLVSQAASLNTNTAYPGRGEILSARGNTLHAVLNAMASFGTTPLFDELNWMAELTWSRWTSVTQGADLFKGRDGYTAIDRVSRDQFGLAFNLAPMWYQALPGMNLSMPLSYSAGLSGNSAVASGGNKGAGSWAAGLALDVRNRHRIELKYVDYFGDRAVDANGVATVFSGGTAPLRDRGAVYFTFKTSI